MRIMHERLHGDESSGRVLAEALRRGPVRAVFQSVFSEFGVYFLSESFVMTRPDRALCSAA